MTEDVLKLAPGVDLAPLYEGLTVDCRLLFLGDRYRQFVRLRGSGAPAVAAPPSRGVEAVD